MRVGDAELASCVGGVEKLGDAVDRLLGSGFKKRMKSVRLSSKWLDNVTRAGRGAKLSREADQKGSGLLRFVRLAVVGGLAPVADERGLAGWAF